MRVLFALSGLHRYNRGAEVAFVSVAHELARLGNTVTLIGSGPERSDTPYRFLRAGSVQRERFETWPSMPVLRNECAYEELTFIPGLLRRYRPGDYDVTLTCGYPFTNWALRRPVLGGRRPPHVFVTQNGDWPAFAENSEYRLFGCEGLVCTNPDFYARNKQRWRSRLIPNGVDRERFRPGEAQRAALGLPVDKLVVLMVSALIASKRVELGIEAISRMPEAYLLVAGDGPRRELIDRQAGELMPGRFSRLTVPSERMPTLYQAADVFMHLSKDEAFGNVFLEAMACGLPVVAGNSSRVRWIVGEDEFLFDADDPATIAHHVERAGAARSHLRARAQKAEAFSWSKIGQMYHDFLGEVMASEARRSHRSDVPQRGST